ncbi:MULTISPECIES: glycosyltransferase family 4 protein [unclassified Oleiphilus]|uniref:glycosyltransferase family 4 protein n=3 Tax=unclassified Oleiphilus TaxID=2631174 RepID=UPI00083842E6
MPVSRNDNVWIINHYASTPSTGMGGRSYFMAKGLAESGVDTTLVCANFNHKLHSPRMIKGAYDVDLSDGFKVARVKVKKYSSSFNKIRIFNWFLFVFRLLVHYRKFGERPTVVICSSPSLVAFLGAWGVARLSKAKLIFDVRDIWPLTLRVLGGYSKRNPLIFLLSKIEHFAYASSDGVMSNLKNFSSYLSEQGFTKKPFCWVPNSVDFDGLAVKSKLPEEFKGLGAGKFVVGYAGSIGANDALEYLLDAAAILRHEAPEIYFVIVGKGQYLEKFRERIDKDGLSNVIFTGPVQKDQVSSALALFDVCYLGWLDDDIYRFGVSPNKIPDYFYAAKPVLHSYSGASDPVELASAGITVSAENAKLIADGIKTLRSMSKVECEQLGVNGRQFAIDNYEYKALSGRLLDYIGGLSA